MCNEILVRSQEATERASRPVVFEHSRTNDFFEFTGLGFFGSFFCQEKNEHKQHTTFYYNNILLRN